MYHNFPARFAISCSLLLVLSASVDAFPRRSWRRGSTSYGSSGIKAVAPKADAVSAQLRALDAYFCYDKAMDDDAAFADRVRIFLLVRDKDVLSTPDSIVAEIKLTDLSDQDVARVEHAPVQFHATASEYQLGVVDITNESGQHPDIEPAKVYRAFVTLRRGSGDDGPDSAIGKLTIPYYFATSDDTRLGRARRHIVMRTFKEFYYAQHGWASEENYPMDCYAYYMWATGSCTVGAQNGRTILDRLFGGRRPFQGGDQIVTLARQGPIHGDYVRIPGHSFMLLAYDPDAALVWTMEGNFNSSIEIAIRSVDAGWTVGHLVEEHVRPGLFQLSRSTASDAQASQVR